MRLILIITLTFVSTIGFAQSQNETKDYSLNGDLIDNCFLSSSKLLIIGWQLFDKTWEISTELNTDSLRNWNTISVSAQDTGSNFNSYVLVEEYNLKKMICIACQFMMKKIVAEVRYLEEYVVQNAQKELQGG